MSTARSQRVLITGAAGLIGGALTRVLAAGGHRIVACDDFSIGTGDDSDEGVVWERLDVAGPDLAERLDRHVPDVVVHCAAHPGGRSNEEPSADVRVNALGSMQVFEWCSRRGTPVVYLSSSIVYGEQPARPISEEAPLHPGTVYAVCKVACEEFLRVLAAAHGLRSTVLRLFATYGPGHRPSTTQGLVNVMLTQLLAGNHVVVRGSLDRVRDFVFVDDAADAIAACLFSERTRGGTFNIGTGHPTTVRQLITELCTALGRDARDVKVEELPPGPGDPLYNVAETSRFKDASDWSARVPFAAGISRLVASRRAAAAR